jgi:lipoprotein NlpI
MIAPVHLVPYYPYPQGVSFLSLEYLSAIALVIGITAACMVLAKKQKLWLTAWCYYVVTLIPVLGIVQVGDQSMADRYTYLPGLGPFFIIGLVIVWVWRTVNALNRPGLVVKVACGAAAIFMFVSLSYSTLKQISIWKNSVTLWSYVIEKEPEKVPFAYYNRGAAYQNLGQFDKALADYNTAISLDPSWEAYNNRGLFFDQIGQPDKAIADYTMSIMLNRSGAVAYNNRGITYERMGQLDKALADYNAAIQLNPYYHRAYLNRGAIFEKQVHYDRAIMDYNATVAIIPNDIDAYNDRGIVYSLFGLYDRALEDFNTALSLNHDFAEAYFNRGRLYSKAGRTELARADYQKACDLRYEKGCNALHER